MVTTLLSPEQQGISIANDAWKSMKGHIRQRYGHLKVDKGPDMGKTIAEVIVDSEPEWQEPNRAYFYQSSEPLFGAGNNSTKWTKMQSQMVSASSMVSNLQKGFLCRCVIVRSKNLLNNQDIFVRNMTLAITKLTVIALTSKENMEGHNGFYIRNNLGEFWR